MRVALLGLLPQTTALNLLEQRGPTDHPGAAAPGPGGQAGVGGGQPGVNRLLALGLTQGGLEGTGVDDRDETGDVSEAQRGQQTGSHRAGARDAPVLATTAGQTDGPARPHPEGVLGQRGVDDIQGGVAGSHTGGEDLGQARNLEDGGAALGVTGDGLLRDRHQRVALGASQCARQTRVQLGLVGVVGTGGGVVLGDQCDVVGLHPQSRQGLGQARAAPAAAGAQCAQAGCWDRGVGAVGVGGDETDHTGHRQPHTGRHRATGQDHRAAALGLHESAATAVVGAREVAVGDALGAHGRGLRGGVHVAEADDRFDRDVVDGAGHDDVGLAQGDLVPALLNGDGRGGAGAHRLDHGAVAADVGLHDVGGHDIGQGLLEDVAGTLLPQEPADEHLAHRLHATEPGALRGGHVGGVDGLEELGRGEAGRQEGVDGGDQVPGGDGVHALGHRGGDAPALRVEVARELAADRARQRGASRHPGQ